MQLAQKVIHSELAFFENYFEQTLQSDVPIYSDIAKYLHKHKGKQIRPLFCLLSARMGGEINEKSHLAACVVELLHTASLVHDDIVDDSMERRGDYSINAIWDNKPAVFAGDILSLKALLLTLVNNDHRILEIYSDAIGQIIEGELLQFRKSLRYNPDEKAYFQIITAKTAGFFAAACAAGASTTFKEESAVAQFSAFGEKVGIAFQLKDDLLDYGNADIGKPTGNDIRDKKITLPLLFALKQVDGRLKKKLIHALRKDHKEAEDINFILHEVNKAGGIQYTTEWMQRYRSEALKILSTFPPSEIREAIEQLVIFTTDRSF